MAKFLGVISNSTKSSCNSEGEGECEGEVLQYSDLDQLSDSLFNETQNLYYDFLQKLKFVNDRELRIHENSNKLVQIYEYLLAMSSKMLIMERETNEIGNSLGQVEATICNMQFNPPEFTCLCKWNKERDTVLNILVQISQDVHRMEKQIEETKEYECILPMEDLRCLTHRFMPFLELHTKILLQMENKIARISDMLKDLEETFFFVHKRLMCEHFHKMREEYNPDC